jgi:DNA-binding phage protein
MPLTHDFKETIRARAQADPEFRQALMREAIECFINGDLATGKAVLRNYVNATIGFQNLEKRTRIPAKSLMRMLGPKGSPSAENLSSILSVLRRAEGVRFTCAIMSARSSRPKALARSANSAGARSSSRR